MPEKVATDSDLQVPFHAMQKQAHETIYVCIHDLHMHAHICTPLAIDACLCLALHVCHVSLHHPHTCPYACTGPCCLPHSIIACTHDQHRHAPILRPPPIETSPCHALYVHLGPAVYTCMPPSPLSLCPHRPLPCLPHLIRACTHMIPTCMHTPPYLYRSIPRHAIHFTYP